MRRNAAHRDEEAQASCEVDEKEAGEAGKVTGLGWTWVPPFCAPLERPLVRPESIGGNEVRRGTRFNSQRIVYPKHSRYAKYGLHWPTTFWRFLVVNVYAIYICICLSILGQPHGQSTDCPRLCNGSPFQLKLFRCFDPFCGALIASLDPFLVSFGSAARSGSAVLAEFGSFGRTVEAGTGWWSWTFQCVGAVCMFLDLPTPSTPRY